MLPERFSKGAAAGMAAATVFLGALTASFLGTGLPVPLELLGGAILTTACIFVGLVVVRLAIRLLSRFPRELLLTGTACIATLVALHSLRFRWPGDLFYPAAIVFVVGIGVVFGAVKSRRFTWVAALALVVNLAGALWLASAGGDPFPVEPEANDGVAPDDLESPGAPGPHRFQPLTYGNGTDRRRAEFREGVAWKSRTVDASKLLPEWKGFKARARRWYWGFDLDEAPLNGRVWLPEGEGPFPLVLVVHGNHRMEEHSDPGYAYLGELLASRGLLTVSVDENFVNGTWSGDFRGKEMALRAWLLLEHLRQWREWSEKAGHPMEGKADLSNVALVGHSRGGEAIAIAAAFNRLAHHPDDATIPFDYRFGIRALVAIAQTDVRYPRRIELEDVSFLALQGSFDNDEASFFGMRQFRRIDLKGSPNHFKASLYIHGANHGQFNTVWGRTDAGPPNSWLLNLAPIIPGEDQRRVAKVAISAFLGATLSGERAYVPFFRDPVEWKWLPEGTYVHRFQDSTYSAVADFEEDIDVTTGSREGVAIVALGFTTWREEELRFRDEETQGTNAVVLGWDPKEGDDRGGITEYTIRRANGFVDAGESSSLAFSASGRVEGDTEPIRPVFDVVLEDDAGEVASVVVTATVPLRVQLLKLSRWNRLAHKSTWEPTLQSFDIPLSRFAEMNPELDVSRLTAIRFRFFGSSAGGVILDDVGFSSR